MQALGVRYAMVRTDEAKREAREQAELELLDTVGPWEIYRVADSEVVEALTVQPVVVAPATATGASATWSWARAGSSSPTSGWRCRPTTALTNGSGSRSRSKRGPDRARHQQVRSPGRRGGG